MVFKGGMPGWDRLLSGYSANDVEMREPYRQSGWVYSAIRHIARPIASVDLEFYGPTRSGTEDTLLDDGPLEAYWKAPARDFQSFESFVLATVGWRKLAGEAFWILGDGALLPFPEVRESYPQMILARPDRMRHVVADGMIQGWEFTDGNGRRHYLLPEQVIHLKQWNP